MKLIIPTLIKLLLFIIFTTANVEYLINKQSNTWLLILAIVLELTAIYLLIYKQFKKIYKQL